MTRGPCRIVHYPRRGAEVSRVDGRAFSPPDSLRPAGVEGAEALSAIRCVAWLVADLVPPIARAMEARRVLGSAEPVGGSEPENRWAGARRWTDRPLVFWPK